MSGTSLDGFDVAICKVPAAAEGVATPITCLHFATLPFPPGYREQVLTVRCGCVLVFYKSLRKVGYQLSAAGTVADVCRFNVLIGKLIAAAIIDTVTAAGGPGGGYLPLRFKPNTLVFPSFKGCK
jgi:hypothetical protein